MNLTKIEEWYRLKMEQKITYSMENRNGDKSYDCSSALYFGLINGGFFKSNIWIGNTDSLFKDLRSVGFKEVQCDETGYFKTKKHDIFIWGMEGQSGGSNGHTGLFIDNNDTIIHCNYGYNGISINNHDDIWLYNNKPKINIFRYDGLTKEDTPNIKYTNIDKKGVFVCNQALPVSKDTNPSDTESPALAYYKKGDKINYDKIIDSNGYKWISYISYSGVRRYIAIQNLTSGDMFGDLS